MQLALFGRAEPARRSRGNPTPAVLEAPERQVERRRAALFRRLSRLMDGRLSDLALTDNRRTILTVRPSRRGAPAPLTLRIHHSFLDASDEALRAVAIFASSRRGSSGAREALATLREHFSHHCRTTRRTRVRRTELRPAGATFDLRELRDDLNATYFDGRLKVAITWGKGGGATARPARPAARGCRVRSRTSTIQLGSYSYEDKLIRIHRTLDQPRVPRYVLEAVVYHEMLHAAIPPVVRNGRRYVHTAEFRLRERRFRLLTRAERWIEENLPALLRDRAR